LVDCELYSEGKTSLTSNMTSDEMEKIEELARWVWNKRFFIPEYGHIIGGNILREITLDCSSDDFQFEVFSSHDYTILALLSALGEEEYPGRAFGFGCFLLIEVYEDSMEERYVKIQFNSHPFEDVHHQPATHVHNRSKIFGIYSLQQLEGIVNIKSPEQNWRKKNDFTSRNNDTHHTNPQEIKLIHEKEQQEPETDTQEKSSSTGIEFSHLVLAVLLLLIPFYLLELFVKFS